MHRPSLLTIAVGLCIALVSVAVYHLAANVNSWFIFLVLPETYLAWWLGNKMGERDAKGRKK